MTRGPAKAAAKKGALWKRWLSRGACIVAFAYLATLGVFFLAGRRPEAILFQSLGLAVMPLLIVVLFALPKGLFKGTFKSGASLVVLGVSALQAGVF